GITGPTRPVSLSTAPHDVPPRSRGPPCSAEGSMSFAHGLFRRQAGGGRRRARTHEPTESSADFASQGEDADPLPAALTALCSYGASCHSITREAPLHRITRR